MKETPQSNRLHVTIFGETNAGKSALFNAITETDIVIVSEVAGTTTDIVSKSMELLPAGPIVLTDTAGLNDSSILGEERIEKTKKAIEKTDLALYALDAASYSQEEYQNLKKELDKRNTDCLVVFTKKDLRSGEIAEVEKNFEDTIAVSINNAEDIKILKEKIAERLEKLKPNEKSLMDGILPIGSLVVMVVPIDSGAPKGRLILPQVQLIRACLDNGIRCLIVTEQYLAQTMQENKEIHLVITDSQIFANVAKIVGKTIPLTSFSILMARQKGDLKKFLQGVRAIESLKNGDKILMAEVCTHNRSHEDIGHIKIPALLKKITQKNLNFIFATGRDYPKNLDQYSLIVHCGACMITQKEMENRLLRAEEEKIPITNYGMVLAYGSGILERSVEIFEKEAQQNY